MILASETEGREIKKDALARGRPYTHPSPSLVEGQGLVPNWFADLVGQAIPFRSVLVVPNLDSIPVLYIGLGTLLAIGFPNNCRHELAVPVD